MAKMHETHPPNKNMVAIVVFKKKKKRRRKESGFIPRFSSGPLESSQGFGQISQHARVVRSDYKLKNSDQATPPPLLLSPWHKKRCICTTCAPSKSHRIRGTFLAVLCRGVDMFIFAVEYNRLSSSPDHRCSVRLGRRGQPTAEPYMQKWKIISVATTTIWCHSKT